LSQNRLSGMLNAKKSSIMTSTIPYSSGWHATLDGKAVKVSETNEAFVGIQVRKGKHRLALYYQTPGLRTGLIISILAAIILLACFYLELEKAKRA
ncbi:MAG: YfhO family protein, partial [Lactobacillus delbrueckii]|nr:YfhO family protein [Lactobacillus delbrueckii]